MSWRSFENEYLDYDVDDAAITTNENSNYIKVVDFNNDGEYDYVFKIDFAMAEVTNVAKSGNVTLSDLNDGDNDDEQTYKADDLVASDELSKGRHHGHHHHRRHHLHGSGRFPSPARSIPTA